MEFGGRVNLVGDFSGNRDAGIRFRFRFCSDGAYFYLVEQPGRWRLAHRGRFQIGSAQDQKYTDKTIYIIRFEPQFIDVPLEDRTGFGLLDERALLADRLEEYIVSKSSWADDWRADAKRVSYSFTRPNPKSRLFSVSWSLEADQ